MKKLLSVVFIFAVLLCSCFKDNKNENTNIVMGQTDTSAGSGKKMYVNASAGLRVRSLPSTDGERIGALEHLTEVNVVREDASIVTIGDVEGKWVYINTPLEGWVFSGYLVNSMDQYYKQAIIGTWFLRGQEGGLVHVFFGDNRWLFGLYESSASEEGTWFIEGTRLIIEVQQYWSENTTYEYEFRFLNADTVRLTGPSSEETYVRAVR